MEYVFSGNLSIPPEKFLTLWRYERVLLQGNSSRGGDFYMRLRQCIW
jgi:hypothetical protein